VIEDPSGQFKSTEDPGLLKMRRRRSDAPGRQLGEDRGRPVAACCPVSRARDGADNEMFAAIAIAELLPSVIDALKGAPNVGVDRGDLQRIQDVIDIGDSRVGKTR